MNGIWTEETLGGKKVDVYLPAGVERPRLATIFLHGIGLETLRGKRAFTQHLDRYKLGCVCPNGARSWWTDHISPEFDATMSPETHLLSIVVPFIKERWNLETKAIGLFGISMGGQGALRLAFRHPQMFLVAAGIASAFDFHDVYGQGSQLDLMYDSKEQCRQDTPLMHVPPYNPPPHLFFCCDPQDVWHRSNDRLHEKLNALGIPHEYDLTTEAGGHSWTYFEHMAERTIRFVYDGLNMESRRLV